MISTDPRWKTMFLLLSLALSLLTSSFESPSAAAAAAEAEAPFNASNPLSTTGSPSPHLFLEGVLRAISVQQGWDLEDVKVCGVRSARVGASQRYELRLRVGKVVLVLRFSDEISMWKKLRRRQSSGLEAAGGLGPKPVIRGLELEGPLELRVNGDDELSLLLPLNTTHRGLKRVLVSEAIALEVEGAQEVTLIHPSNLGFPVNRSLVGHVARKHSMPFGHSTCMPLLQIHISGSASLFAYRKGDPTSHIRTTFLSLNTIELLPDKCYTGHNGKIRPCPIHSLISRLALVEKLLKSFLGDRIFQNQSAGLLKAKITASTIVQFQLELERDLGRNNMTQSAAWRTKPKMERVQFEVMARVETERLKPLMVKKVTPFVPADTTTWSNLMSNISFTQIPSLVVHPESLTLDVKW